MLLTWSGVHILVDLNIVWVDDQSYLKSLELLRARCRGRRVGWVSVTLDQSRAVGLYGRAVVMGAAVSSRVWNMPMTARALSHSRNLQRAITKHSSSNDHVY